MLSKRMESVAPGDQLVQHIINIFLLLWAWLEYSQMLEIDEYRKANLSADGSDLQCCQDQSQMFDSTCSHCVAITNKSCRFVCPFHFQVIDRVFESSEIG